MSKWFLEVVQNHDGTNYANISVRNLREGDRVQISGDSADLWLSDYNVRVNTEGTVLETPAPNDKKVFVCIDSIDGDQNVYAYVRKSRIELLEHDAYRDQPSLNETLQTAKERSKTHSASHGKCQFHTR